MEPKINYVITDDKKNEEKKEEKKAIEHTGSPLQESFMFYMRQLIAALPTISKTDDTMEVSIGDITAHDGRLFQVKIQLTSSDTFKIPRNQVVVFGLEEELKKSNESPFKTPHGQA